ncbi:DUF3108 domain-containing protein [Bauldia sp.]|uniref:DUF3108 domain-containing protein n=1 Tax=Bauldia sp. TaxID=2575872 RepID=UPI003BABE218
MIPSRCTIRVPPGLGCRLSAALLVALVGLSPATADTTTTLDATYTISLGSIVVGRATAESRFTGDDYIATVTGSTGGVSRLVSDAEARLSGYGRISGSSVLPASFDLETAESGFNTYVHMDIHRGQITNLIAIPSLAAAPDRVPVTATHKTDIVDPLGAFLVPLDRANARSGRAICDRTVKVFDGWTRFDIELFYKATKAVDGPSNTYAGPVIVCGARYKPIAGHRTKDDALEDLVGNDRLEVWLAPVGDSVLVPFRIVIGTRWGDLVVHATRFTIASVEDRASLD